MDFDRVLFHIYFPHFANAVYSFLRTVHVAKIDWYTFDNWSDMKGTVLGFLDSLSFWWNKRFYTSTTGQNLQSITYNGHHKIKCQVAPVWVYIYVSLIQIDFLYRWCSHHRILSSCELLKGSCNYFDDMQYFICKSDFEQLYPAMCPFIKEVASDFQDRAVQTFFCNMKGISMSTWLHPSRIDTKYYWDHCRSDRSSKISFSRAIPWLQSSMSS